MYCMYSKHTECTSNNNIENLVDVTHRHTHTHQIVMHCLDNGTLCVSKVYVFCRSFSLLSFHTQE